MLRSSCALVALAGGMLFASVMAADPGRTESKPATVAKNADVLLERYKKLAGDWQEANPKNEAARGKIVARYRLTAGGTVIVETIFPDDPMEMVTTYHRDGDQFMLTHYCCCGNQPRMRARSGADKDEVVFEFAGGTNLNPAKDTHMHNCRVRFVDGDHLHADWQLYVDGKPASTHTVDLVRKK
jgi:hypothetical protein